MKPVIGITPSLQDESVMLHRDLTHAVFKAGGIPVILPYPRFHAHGPRQYDIEGLTERVDGLLLSGGGDIDPTLFGEEPLPGLGQITPDRDRMEIELIQHFMEKDLPVFAICRGCQILNIAAGGTMFQDLYRQRRRLLQHFQHAPRHHASHFITIQTNTLLHTITGLDVYKVNSFHHQAVKDPAPDFIASATSRDGVIEAVESRRHRFVLGVQWHPENMTETDEMAQNLFEKFVEACR